MRGSGNTRWCPTPQQLIILDQLYSRGLKTPTASQIHKITAHLSLYGNIQGKNVFYWFQNHKARDRQKLRLHYHRLLHHPPPPPPPPPSCFPFQGSGVREEEVPQATMFMRSDPTVKDCLMTRTTTTTYGHDSTKEAGPTIPCCRRSHEPLQTLELFPLTASSHPHQKSPTNTPWNLDRWINY